MTTGTSRVCRTHLFLIGVMVCAAHPTLLTCRTATAADPNWFALQPVKDSFGPSILDCSGWVEAPTGKHGFVTVKGDRFVFEDGTPVRFWGAQVGGFSKEQVDYAVRRMRRQGINITRMHGLESLNDRSGRTSFDYSEAGFDRLDYLIRRLGENGIYMILDVHYPLTYRFKPGDEIPGLPQGGPASHAQFFNEKVAAIMHRRMADIFTHLNPYTKKRYCDDPTIAMVEVLNEDSLFWGEIASRSARNWSRSSPTGCGPSTARLPACERPGWSMANRRWPKMKDSNRGSGSACSEARSS